MAFLDALVLGRGFSSGVHFGMLTYAMGTQAHQTLTLLTEVSDKLTGVVRTKKFREIENRIVHGKRRIFYYYYIEAFIKIIQPKELYCICVCSGTDSQDKQGYF